MTVASSQIVYCVAQAGTGKTFTGDYLDLIHGFYHVDGDIPFRTAHLPKSREAIKQLFSIDLRYPNHNNEHSPEQLAKYEKYWTPLFQMMVDSALEAAKTNDRVVITFADGSHISRDFVMKKLKEGGAENVTLMYLSMDLDKKLEGLYYRSKRQAEAAGMSLGDMMKLDPEWNGEGEDPSLEEYIAFNKRPGRHGSPKDWDEAPPYAKVVDVTGRDVTAIDGVDAALGLQRSGDKSYDEIVEMVVARDHKRDEETPYSMEIFPEIDKEIKEALANAKTSEEKASIKRRASSIIKLEVMTRGLSVSSVDSKNSRRASLIGTGSCKNII